MKRAGAAIGDVARLVLPRGAECGIPHHAHSGWPRVPPDYNKDEGGGRKRLFSFSVNGAGGVGTRDEEDEEAGGGAEGTR